GDGRDEPGHGEQPVARVPKVDDAAQAFEVQLDVATVAAPPELRLEGDAGSHEAHGGVSRHRGAAGEPHCLQGWLGRGRREEAAEEMVAQRDLVAARVARLAEAARQAATGAEPIQPALDLAAAAVLALP